MPDRGAASRAVDVCPREWDRPPEARADRAHGPGLVAGEQSALPAAAPLPGAIPLPGRAYAERQNLSDIVIADIGGS